MEKEDNNAKAYRVIVETNYEGFTKDYNRRYIYIIIATSYSEVDKILNEHVGGKTRSIEYITDSIMIQKDLQDSFL